MSRKRKKSPKRSLTIDCGDTGQVGVLSKVVAIHLEKVKKEFVHFDRLEDGTWRMTVSSETIPDANKLQCILIRPLDDRPGVTVANLDGITKAEFETDGV